MNVSPSERKGEGRHTVDSSLNNFSFPGDLDKPSIMLCTMTQIYEHPGINRVSTGPAKLTFGKYEFTDTDIDMQLVCALALPQAC